jgi:hypothetical protein
VTLNSVSKPLWALWIKIDNPIEILACLSSDRGETIAFEKLDTMLKPAVLGSDYAFRPLGWEVKSRQEYVINPVNHVNPHVIEGESARP